MPRTGIIQITDTLKYTPKELVSPKTNTEDDLQQEIGYITERMKYPPT